jgi:pSer/pThr/pTyr-binding forkhead associated (FHA) protein
VEFHLNTDADAGRQRLTVECLLAPPAPATNDLDGQSTMRAPENEPEPVEATLRTPRDTYSQPQKGGVFAKLTYSDDRGDHTFDIVKDVTKIGRYDPDYLTDVALHTKTDVGREHLVIRRNAQNGRFTATDSSKFGTWINGVQLRSQQDVELPSKADINLANVVSISFRKAK